MAHAARPRSSRRPLLVGLVFFLASLPATGQETTWTKQAPIPSAGTISGVAPLSATEVWCSATVYPFSYNGHVAHTADAGLNWEVTELDAGGVNAIFFLDSQHGWTAGGAFRHTTDGGKTWIKDNDWGSIYDLFFLDTQRGWACGNGGVAYYTTDGGLNWASVVTGAATTLSSIWFQDALNGWTVSIGGRIFRSTDGGQTWSMVLDSGAYLSTVQFVSPLEGWAIGGNTYLHTTDGGQNWTPVPVPAGTWSYAARFFDALNGVAVGDGGNIVRTVDGGQTWVTVQPSGSGPGLSDVEYGDAQTVFCSGGGGVIARSTNGGATWRPIQSGGAGIVRAIDIHDGQRAWAAQQGGEIMRTINGGKRWEREAVDGFNAAGELEDIDFIDANTGWTVGRTSTTGGYDGRIARSADGGQTWTMQLSIPYTRFMGVVALDNQRAIAVGRGSSQNTYRQTSDGGQNWTGGGPQASNGYTDICFLDDGLTGWLVGDDIHKTTDGGSSWFLQYSNPGPPLSAVSFADANHGWAVGYVGLVLHTTDGGQSWAPQDVGASSGTAIMGVTAVDSMTAWVAGWYGFVARTTDGGANWQSETIPGTEGSYFEFSEFLDEEIGWVGGDYGIYRRGGYPGCLNATTYCVALPNSTGSAATIGMSGSCIVHEGNLVLEASPVPDQPYLFFYGENQIEVPFGNGVRCVGDPLVRLFPPQIASGGLATRLMDPAAHGFVAGDSANFQCWYRDPAGGGFGFNLSDGLHIVFQ